MNVLLETKKDGITGDMIHNVMIVQENGSRVCHSSFNELSEAVAFKDVIAKRLKDGLDIHGL